QPGGIAGGERAVAGALVERRLQRSQFFQRGVRTQEAIAPESAERHQQIVEEAGIVGSGQLVVAVQRQLILCHAADLPLPGHLLAMVAHRLAGARFGHAGEGGFQFAEGEPAQRGLQFVERCLRTVHRQQALAQAGAVDDRHVAGGVRAGGDAGLDLAGGDLVGDDDGIVERGAAGARGGDARRGRRQPGTEQGLAREVPVRRVLDHRAQRHFAQFHAVQAEALDQGAQHFHRHAEVADVGVGRVVATERDAYAANDPDAPVRVFHALNSPSLDWFKANPPCRRAKAHGVGVMLFRSVLLPGGGNLALIECAFFNSPGCPIVEAQTLLALPVLLALEPVAGEPPARMTLGRDEAAALAQLVATDLLGLVPQVAAARLVLAGALFDPVELLRPGFPVWSTLDELARRVPRGTLENVVAFGSHAGRMPALPLEPSPIHAAGPMRLLPISLLAPAALADELSSQLEIQLVGRGEAGVLTADWLMRTLGIRLEHVRYLSRNDLLALTCVQYEHVNLAPLWALLETALLTPQREESTLSARGLALRYAD